MGETDGGIPILAGTVGGLLAWGLGYLFTYMVAADRIMSHQAAQFLEGTTDGTAGWKMVGWLFYNAHHVEISLPQLGILSPRGYNAIAADDGLLWMLYLLPPVLLVITGLLVTWLSRTPVRSVHHGAVVGATVAFGYLLGTVGGLAAFTVGVNGDVIRPDPITSILLAGALYPMVCGAIGGTVAGLTTRVVRGIGNAVPS